MFSTKSPPFAPFLFVGILLTVLGWGGLAAVIWLTLPNLGPRWLFFFFFVLGITGLVMPVVSFLHVRFPSEPPSTPSVVVRQSLLVGIYAGILAWLQLGGVLDTTRAVFLAAGFILVEILLRIREQSQWTPPEEEHE